ncbi:MAG: hypothetical protein AAFR04_13125 [Pseudomonadota bacterium]
MTRGDGLSCGDFGGCKRPLWLVAFVAGLVCLMAAFASRASAGDFSHTCFSADGDYSMVDGALFKRHYGGKDDGKFLKASFAPVANKPDIVLREEAGYCLSESKPCENTKFPYQSKSYVRFIKVKSGDYDNNVEVALFCDLASSGLAAACSCDRDVQTLKRVLTPRYNVTKTPQAK